MTGFTAASVSSQPLRDSRGVNAVVRKANGKNSRKLVFTAAGLPVFSAIAYGKPVNARPHRR